MVKRGGIKEFLRQNKMRTSEGLYEAVNASVEGLLKKACFRAEKGGRSTVMGWDI